MKSRSIIFSIAILIALSFTTLSFSQSKSDNKSKTINKTEKITKNNIKPLKITGHESTMKTTSKEEVGKAKVNPDKIAMNNNKTKNDKKETMKNKSKVKYKKSNVVKEKPGKNKKEK